MATLYSSGVSTCHIAGAVAAAAIHDLQVNLFTFGGFPQIAVAEPAGETFAIQLTYEHQGQSAAAEFELTRQEAFAAAKHFMRTKGKGYDAAIFSRVQDALVELERLMSAGRQRAL